MYIIICILSHTPIYVFFDRYGQEGSYHIHRRRQRYSEAGQERPGVPGGQAGASQDPRQDLRHIMVKLDKNGQEYQEVKRAPLKILAKTSDI